MSLYSKTAQIDGLPIGLVMRGAANGQYVIIIERSGATLEQIEAVNWARPTIEGDCILPMGYGFEVEGISYSSSDNSYRVVVRVAEQYLGDVTSYVARVAELEAQNSDLTAAVEAERAQSAALSDQLAEADEALIALYEAGLTETAPTEGAEEVPAKETGEVPTQAEPVEEERA